MDKPLPKFFERPSDFREWLQENHSKFQELWLGSYKKDCGKTGVTYLEALDQALCYGWIDGRIKSIDETSYAIRFTPRKPRSTWSARNIQRVRELTRLGLMKPSGLKAFDQRREASGAHE